MYLLVDGRRRVYPPHEFRLKGFGQSGFANLAEAGQVASKHFFAVKRQCRTNAGGLQGDAACKADFVGYSGEGYDERIAPGGSRSVMILNRVDKK